MDSDRQYSLDAEHRQETHLVDRPISDSDCKPRHWDHRLDEHRGSSQETELVGNFVDCSGGRTDCAWISRLGGLRTKFDNSAAHRFSACGLVHFCFAVLFARYNSGIGAMTARHLVAYSVQWLLAC